MTVSRDPRFLRALEENFRQVRVILMPSEEYKQAKPKS